MYLAVGHDLSPWILDVGLRMRLNLWAERGIETEYGCVYTVCYTIAHRITSETRRRMDARVHAT